MMKRLGKIGAQIILILAFLLLGLTNIITPAAAADPINKVRAEFHTHWHHTVVGESFTNQQVIGRKSCWADIWNEPDTTGAPVNNAELSIASELVFDYVEEENLQQMGPTDYIWAYGNIPEGAYARNSGRPVVDFDSSELFTPGFDASRSANKTEFFQSEGMKTQVLTITLRPEDITEGISIHVSTIECELVDAVIKPPTGDYNWELSEDGRWLGINPSGLETETLYFYYVAIEVTPKASHVEFMPCVHVGWHTQVAYGTTDGEFVQCPSGGPISELGTWKWSAEGSYSWKWNESLHRGLTWYPYCREIVEPVNRLHAGFSTNWHYSVPGDTFDDQPVTGEKSWHTGLQNWGDETGEVINGVMLTLQSEHEFDYINPEPDPLPTDPPTWSFGTVLQDSEVHANVGAEPGTFTPGFNVYRSFDTVFTAPDTRYLTVDVTPQTEAESVYVIHVDAFGTPLANAMIGSVSTSPGYEIRKFNNEQYARIEIMNLGFGETFTATIQIHVAPNLPKVEYMPAVGISRVQKIPLDIVTTNVVELNSEIGTWTWNTSDDYEWYVHQVEGTSCDLRLEPRCQILTACTDWENLIWSQYATYEDDFNYLDNPVTGYKFWHTGVDFHGRPMPDAGWEVTLDSPLDFTYHTYHLEAFEHTPGTYKWTFWDPDIQIYVYPVEPIEVNDLAPVFDAERSVDKRIFLQSAGTQDQKLTVSITPQKVAPLAVLAVRVEGKNDMNIPIDEDNLVDAQIISGSDSAGYIESGGHSLFREISGSEWQVGVEWTYDIDIKVTPNVAEAEFMPEVLLLVPSAFVGGGAFEEGTSHSYPMDSDFQGTWTWTSDVPYLGGWISVAVDSVNFLGYTKDASPVAVANIDPYLAPVGSGFTFDGSASYDPDGTIESYEWDFGDGSAGSGMTANHAYQYAGLYRVVLTVTDDKGVQSTDSVMAIVYDPSAGFATGGGWFIPGGKTSYNDDFLPNIDGTSPANFGFVVKYKKGADTPDGQLEFQYQQGDFNLHSTGMEWLVVTNKNWAKFQGLATIKGLDGLCPFHVDARDGDFGGGDQPDRFIIKVYAPGDTEQANPIYKASGDLEGGNIVIHSEGYEVTTLRLQTWLPFDNPLTTPLENFALAVAQGTEGLVRIELYQPNELVPGPELASAIQWGDVEMGLIPTGTLSAPLMQAASLPFLYNDDDGLTAAVQAGIGDILSQELASHNITALDWVNLNIAHLFHMQEILAYPDDMIGERMRAIGIQGRAIEEWAGTNPFSMPAGQLYMALRDGLIDGGVFPLDGYCRFKLYEVAPYFCVDNAFGALAGLCINSDVWNGLDESVKQVITQAVSDYASEILATVKQMDADALQFITDYGINIYTLTPEERAIWRDVSLPIWQSWLNEVGAVGQQIIDIALAHNPLP